MLEIRLWKTATTAAPAPRKTSASASVSERRDGVPPLEERTTVVTLCVGLVFAFVFTVVTLRALGPAERAGGSHTRQTAIQIRPAASGIRTSGAKFAPAHANDLSAKDMGETLRLC